MEVEHDEQEIIQRVAALDIGRPSWCVACGCLVLAGGGCRRFGPS